jgi:hypothetical protein
MEFSTYNPCLLVISLKSECFGVIKMQTDDILGFSDKAFITKKFKELIFAAKKKQFLTSDNAFFLMNVSSPWSATHYVFARRTRGKGLRRLRIAQLTSSNELEEPILPQSASLRPVLTFQLPLKLRTPAKKKLPD